MYEAKKVKLYWRHKNTLYFINLIILILFLALIQFSGISAHLKNFSLSLNGNFYIALFIYLVIFCLSYYILTFPLDLYEGFFLERAFSLSNQNLAAWFKDEIKKVVISFLVFLILVEAFYMIARTFTTHWWIISSIAYVAFSILFMKVFPILIIPLFYKYTPIRKDELRYKVLELAKIFDIKVLDAFEIDFSSKTKKSNAAIVGWGDTRRIILTDNLLNDFTSEEVTVVVAHEMAHHKLRHAWKLLFFGAISTTLSFYIFSRIAQSLPRLLGAAEPFDMAIFPAISILFIIYELLILPVQNGLSRKYEKDADILALKATKLKKEFISLMERLAEKNLSDKNPNRLIEILLYTHPPIAKRIELAHKEVV